MDSNSQKADSEKGTEEEVSKTQSVANSAQQRKAEMHARLQSEMEEAGPFVRLHVTSLQNRHTSFEKRLKQLQQEYGHARAMIDAFQGEKEGRERLANQIHNRTICPEDNCGKDFNTGNDILSVPEIVEHAKTHFKPDSMHVSKQRCDVPLCHAILADLLPNELEDHRLMHRQAQVGKRPTVNNGQRASSEQRRLEIVQPRTGISLPKSLASNNQPPKEIQAAEGSSERPACKKGEKRYCNHCFTCTMSFNIPSKRLKHFKSCNSPTNREICLKPEQAKQKKVEKQNQKEQNSTDRVNDNRNETVNEGDVGNGGDGGDDNLPPDDESAQSGGSERFFEIIDDSAWEIDEDSSEDNMDIEPQDKDIDAPMFGLENYNEAEDKTYDPRIGLIGRVDLVREKTPKGTEIVDEEEGEYDEEVVRQSRESR